MSFESKMAAAQNLEQWALPRIQQLLPLDEESLKQVVQYADTLSKDAAAEHLKNLLGDDGKALEFISAFNLRRPTAPSGASQQAPSSSTSSTMATNHDRQGGLSEVPRTNRGGRGKKKPNIHSLPARQLAGQGNVGNGYVKRDEEDYMPKSARRQNERQTHKDAVAETMALREERPDATRMPLVTDDASATSQPITSKAPPSAAGTLISDSLAPKKAASSRNASPAPKTKVNITGGTAMHGASSALSDLDSAIKSLEVQTNPSLAGGEGAEMEKRKCNCMATRHPLLDMAPNCLKCGKIICVKQGLGPCTFCGSPLLSSEDIAKVLRVLKDERGEERMRTNNAAHKKADVAHGKSRALTGRDFLAQASSNRSSPMSSAAATPSGSDDEAADKAKQHRDKLLGFQAQNARRTQIHDEAADYDVPASGTNMWASPAERAQQLKRQQRVLREMEWNARPEYEKRQMVASIDLQGRKVVRKMAAVEKPDFAEDENVEPDGDEGLSSRATGAPGDGGGGGGGGGGKGAFSNNPLAKGLIRPQMREDKGKGRDAERKTAWRRVQMDEDQDDNEAWILDGGMYGGKGGTGVGNGVVDEPLGAEERGCG